MSQEMLFTLMAHAEDMQNIAKETLSISEKTIKNLEDKTNKIIDYTKNELNNTTRKLLAEAKLFLTLCTIIITIGISVIFFFTFYWSSGERDKLILKRRELEIKCNELESQYKTLQLKIDNLDYTKQKYAQITEVKGKKGYYVHIDPKEEPFTLLEGGKVAKLMPVKLK
jgi:Tfp pilus assembly protein PilO